MSSLRPICLISLFGTSFEYMLKNITRYGGVEANFPKMVWLPKGWHVTVIMCVSTAPRNGLGGESAKRE